MGELIKVTEKGGLKLVDGRDLHEFLGIKRDFPTWIKQRLEKYGFIKDQDFSTISGKTSNGRPRVDYAFSVDMAKELGMIENNDKGREVRRYFIELEKNQSVKSLSTPQTFADALQLAADQAKQIEIQGAKVQSLEEALDTSEQWISIIRAAKDCGVHETSFRWGVLKKYSIANGIEMKSAPCPRFGTKKLYHISVFKNCYTELTTTL